MKAFIYQDHEAHIATHTSFMQDPMIAQTIGQNPQAQQIMASLQAHIAEHLGYKYRKDIEERVGVELPAPNAELPEEIEINLARMVATASAQLSQEHQKQAAQQQAQQQAQDPMYQLQQQEVQIKQQEVQRKTQKDQADVMRDVKKLELDKLEIEIDAKKDGIKMAADRRTSNAKLDLDAIKTMQDAKNRNQ